MRVLMVAPRFFPLQGGIETHIYEVGRRLVHFGVGVTVLTTDASRKLPPTEEIEGMEVIRVPAYPPHADLYYAPRITRVIRCGDWDVVHCQGCHSLVPPVALPAARRAGIPTVLTLHTGGHSSRLRMALRGLQWQLLGPSLRSCRRLIGVSHYEIEYFQRALGLAHERFVYIPNGGQLPPVGTVAYPRNDGIRRVVSVGRLERYKGHHRVVAALPRVRAALGDVRVTILGNGPEEGQLRRQAAQLGVGEHVTIRSIPSADRNAMAATLAGADLVTLLSDAESHPVAVVEALALHRPVLVADNTGMSEIARQNWARAISLPAATEEIAQAIIGQLVQPLVPQNVELPTWDDCAGQILATYHAVLETAPCAS